MNQAVAVNKLWQSLCSVKQYIQQDLLTQMSGAESFGGEDMKPVHAAHKTMEEVQPFLPLPVSGAAKQTFQVLERELNVWLDRIRTAIVNSENPQVVVEQLRVCYEHYSRELKGVEDAMRMSKERESAGTIFSAPIFGTVNFGTIAGDIISTVTPLAQDQRSEAFAEAIKGLTEALENNSDLPIQQKKEAFEGIKTLVSQAALPPEKRESGIFNAVLKYLPSTLSATGAGIKFWEEFGPAVEGFFRHL